MKTEQIIRTDSTDSNYLNIASDAVLHFDAIEAQLQNPATDGSKTLHLRCRRFEQYAITVVFSGMCLESFLYDYAAYGFSDSFVQQHFDKMSFTSKCEAYPCLIAGRSIDKSGKMWNAIMQLKKERDSLVHAKSVAPHQNAEIESQRHFEREKAFCRLPYTLVRVYSSLMLYAEALVNAHHEAKHPNPFPDLFFRNTSQAYSRVVQCATVLPFQSDTQA